MFYRDDWVPKRLDEVITKNKNKLKLEYVSLSDMSNLDMPITLTNLKGVLEDAFLYKRIIQDYPIQHVFLVGFLKDGSGRNAYHTSPIKNVDLKTSTVLTSSGSNYIIKSIFSGEPKQDLLLHICHMAYRDGWGKYFGVLEVFY